MHVLKSLNYTLLKALKKLYSLCEAEDGIYVDALIQSALACLDFGVGGGGAVLVRGEPNICMQSLWEML